MKESELNRVSKAAFADFDRIDYDNDRNISYLEIMEYKRSDPTSTRVQEVSSLLEKNYKLLSKIDPADRESISKHELEVLATLTSSNPDALRELTYRDAYESRDNPERLPFQPESSLSSWLLAGFSGAVIGAIFIPIHPLAVVPVGLTAGSLLFEFSELEKKNEHFDKATNYYEQWRKPLSKLEF